MKSRSDATTVNKVCASGMKSIMFAAQSIFSGYKDVVAAGGMESMSNAPYVSLHPCDTELGPNCARRFLLPRQNPTFGRFTTRDSLETDGLWDVYNNFGMGNCGEAAATKFKITRQSQDAHAIESYKRAARAWTDGAFDAEIAPVTIKGKKGDTIVKEDEEYKRVIFEKVPTLKPSFKKDGSITAANSSPISDGASALVLTSAEKAKDLGLKPLARIICMSKLWHGTIPFADDLAAFSDVGVNPIDFPEAPTLAIPIALRSAGLEIRDIARFEINEAFSVVVRIAEQALGVSYDKINIDG
jgi:acetyl-CoA C-acetyltransferase